MKKFLVNREAKMEMTTYPLLLAAECHCHSYLSVWLIALFSWKLENKKCFHGWKRFFLSGHNFLLMQSPKTGLLGTAFGWRRAALCSLQGINKSAGGATTQADCTSKRTGTPAQDSPLKSAPQHTHTWMVFRFPNTPGGVLHKKEIWPGQHRWMQ